MQVSQNFLNISSLTHHTTLRNHILYGSDCTLREPESLAALWTKVTDFPPPAESLDIGLLDKVVFRWCFPPKPLYCCRKMFLPYGLWAGKVENIQQNKGYKKHSPIELLQDFVIRGLKTYLF